MTMRRFLEACLGLNGAALIRGVRRGPREFYRGCRGGFVGGLTFGRAGSDSLRELPVRSLDEVLGSRAADIRLRVARYEDGMQPIKDALALLSLLVVENPALVLEIGTYMGHTTRAMAENLAGAIIHTVDLPPDYTGEREVPSGIPKDDFHLIQRRVVGREFESPAWEGRIIQHFGDTANFDFSAIGSANFCFIDGSHTYEYCRNDSEKCLSIASKDATFLWHDCDEQHPGVVRCLNEWRVSGKDIVRIEGTSLAYWKRDASAG